MAIEYHLRKHEDKGQFIPQGSGERLMFITHGTSNGKKSKWFLTAVVHGYNYG